MQRPANRPPSQAKKAGEEAEKRAQHGAADQRPEQTGTTGCPSRGSPQPGPRPCSHSPEGICKEGAGSIPADGCQHAPAVPGHGSHHQPGKSHLLRCPQGSGRHRSPCAVPSRRWDDPASPMAPQTVIRVAGEGPHASRRQGAYGHSALASSASGNQGKLGQRPSSGLTARHSAGPSGRVSTVPTAAETLILGR